MAASVPKSARGVNAAGIVRFQLYLYLERRLPCDDPMAVRRS